MVEIPGFRGRYLISKRGVVIDKRYSKPVPRYVSKEKFEYVQLFTAPRQMVIWRVHRLVALAYVPNPYKLQHIRHKDGNTLNNKASNLEWVGNKYGYY